MISGCNGISTFIGLRHSRWTRKVNSRNRRLTLRMAADKPQRIVGIASANLEPRPAPRRPGAEPPTVELAQSFFQIALVIILLDAVILLRFYRARPDWLALGAGAVALGDVGSAVCASSKLPDPRHTPRMAVHRRGLGKGMAPPQINSQLLNVAKRTSLATDSQG